MQKRKLNYRFHNPYPVEAAADYILKIFMEANLGKLEQAIREASDQQGQETPRGQEMRAGGYTSEEAAQEAGYAV